MPRNVFQINHKNRLEIEKYIKVFQSLDCIQEKYKELESRCVKMIADDMIYLRWNKNGHMMGWKRISQETKIPIEIIKHFRTNLEYKKSLQNRLESIGIDMIDGLAMKKNQNTENYISSKFGIDPIVIQEILEELEPRESLTRRSPTDPEVTDSQLLGLIMRTQRHLKHKINPEDSKGISSDSVQWIVSRGYLFSLAIAEKATGMIFALKGHQMCGKCQVPIYF